MKLMKLSYFLLICYIILPLSYAQEIELSSSFNPVGSGARVELLLLFQMMQL